MRIILWAAAAAMSVTAFGAALKPAEAQPYRPRTVYSEPQGPTYSGATRGGRARITVRPRSYLDLGTEVLPGERKYSDYAFPPTYSPTAVIDNTLGFHRHPLPGPFDLPSKRNPGQF